MFSPLTYRVRYQGPTRRRPLGLALATLTGALLGLTATPAIASQDAGLGRCVQEVREAGLLGPQTNPGTANYIVGTEGNDAFSSSDLAFNGEVDIICGLGGDDSAGLFVGLNDIFVGGTGNDSVDQSGGTFEGGDGDDFVNILNRGTFNGGAGNDGVGEQVSGTFEGGAGNDSVGNLLGTGTFNGGDGNDTVQLLEGGTFNGGNGNDSVVEMTPNRRTGEANGTFNGGEGNDTVSLLSGGAFNGDAGNDSVTEMRLGSFNGGADDDSVTLMTDGTFNGGAGDDSISDMYDGTFNGGAGCDTVQRWRGGVFDPGDYDPDRRCS